MIIDPFQRLRELVNRNFPNGDPTKIAIHIGDPKGNPHPAADKYFRENVALNTYHPLATLPDLKEAIRYYSKKLPGQIKTITAKHSFGGYVF